MRRRTITLLAGMAAWAAGAAPPAPTAPVLEVRLAPGAIDEAAQRGTVRVAMTVPGLTAAAGRPLFETMALPDLHVRDARGDVPRLASDKPGWAPARPVSGTIRVSYTLAIASTPDNGGTTPIFPRIDGAGFSAIGLTLLPIPVTDKPYRVRIAWDLSAMGAGATAVSSAGDGDAELPAGPVSRLSLTAFMAGRLQRDPATGADGNFSAAWSGDPGFDPRPAMRWSSRLHAYMMQFFDTPDDPAYRVFLRSNGGRNPGGGVAFANSFIATWGPGVTGSSMEQILGHEMTHTFTANGLGKWYDEGDAVFYQVRLPWWAGMVSTETYLRDINATAARYYTNAEINAPEARVIPEFFTNRWMTTLAYDRGALYFAALDGMIRRASGGRRSVDDPVRAMVHAQRAGRELTEADWVALLRKESGEAGVALHRSMMAGGLVVPASGDFGPCFRRVDTKIRRYQLGFTAKPGPDGLRIVTGLIAGSEAARAGLHEGDAVRLPVMTTEDYERHPDLTLSVHVIRNGVATSVTYLPRGAAFPGYQWERVEGVPDARCRP